MLIALIVGAMVVGGGGAFVAMKVLGGKSSAPTASVASDSESAEAPEASSHATAPSDDEEPIVAPSKSGGGASSGGGHGAAASEGGGEGGAAVAAGPVTVKLDPFTTNLNSAGGRAFIKLTMSFEMDGQEGADQVTAKMDSIRDVIIGLLMGISADDISTPDGIIRLKTQIQSRVNAQLPDYKVRKVNITDIAIQ
jgi:flagellar FliL protein